MSTIYNRIAWCYDFLKQAVFGKTLEDIQREILEKSPFAENVLVVGGGTGKILDFISPSSVVDFVEPSREMLKRAQKRNHPDARFHELGFNEFCAAYPNQNFDVIIFPFVLDLLPKENIGTWLDIAEERLTAQGKLVVVDFDGDRLSSPGLLYRAMLLFFTLATKHAPHTIYPFRSMIREAGWIEESIILRQKPRLFAGIYWKNEHIVDL